MTAHVLTKGRAERALELHEKGLPASIIAERLGIDARHVQGMLQRARERREAAKEKELRA